MPEHRISILCDAGVHRATEKGDPRGCPGGGCICGCHERPGREPDKLVGAAVQTDMRGSSGTMPTGY